MEARCQRVLTNSSTAALTEGRNLLSHTPVSQSFPRTTLPVLQQDVAVRCPFHSMLFKEAYNVLEGLWKMSIPARAYVKHMNYREATTSSFLLQVRKDAVRLSTPNEQNRFDFGDREVRSLLYRDMLFWNNKEQTFNEGRGGLAEQKVVLLALSLSFVVSHYGRMQHGHVFDKRWKPKMNGKFSAGRLKWIIS